MEIAVIGDEDTVLGLKLAGVNQGYIIEDPLEAEKKISELKYQRKVGLIIITEQLAAKIKQLIKNIIKEGFPIIIEIPDKKGPLREEEDPIRELIRKAVGVDIKIGAKTK
ncbi:MAG: V-type ATP synthase subunit F [Candidatus Odinarchaeia archaeon]